MFVVIFGGLLLTATFTDLQISTVLTNGVLAKDSYLTNSFFGAVFETVGSVPVYLLLSFCAEILFWYVCRIWKKGFLKDFVALVCLGLAEYALYFFFNESVGYVLQHAGVDSFGQEPMVTGVCLFFSFLMVAVSTAAVGRFSNESLKNLTRFVVAALLIVVVSELIVGLLKSPVGRMRYRAMNTAGGRSIGGFSNFTRWYVVNGQKYSKDEMLTLFGSSDACRSFPSGHTCAAGMSYCAILLIDALGIKSKKCRAALWILPIVYTGIVAVSRIMVGAHFFSDVLVGGTVPFFFTIVFREIFFCKNSHLKAVFSK